MTRLRLTILCEYPTLSGGENSLLAVIERLPADMFDVTVLAPPAGPLADRLRGAGISHAPLQLHDEQGRKLSRDAAIEVLVGAIQETRPNLLHANSLSMGRLTGAAADRLSCPTTAHLRDILSLSRAAARDLNRNAALVAVSNATRRYHIGQGVDADKTTVIYNGVDCERFAPRPRDGRFRREFGIPDDAFLIAAIGQICLRKGLDVLAHAAAVNARSLPTAHYVLVGERFSAKQESVDFEQGIVGRFAAAGMADRLHLTGPRDDVDRILTEVDLLVHAAHQEPLGRVLLEAAAVQTPIVATDVGGTREILRDGEDAILIAPGDPELLAAAIGRLAADRAFAASLAQSARRRVMAEFNIDSRAAELAAFWQNVANP
ncbi:MAG: glycosyltransferase family 1 protein [Planctomycetota bacterium]|nr:MAG: glycosyltransferase family 1 protein [Planctomycetota bacterium]